MASFSARETSRSLGAPVFLYLFRYGPDADAIHAFTDADQSIVYGGVTYLPAPITHANIESTGALDDKEFEITVAGDNPVAQLMSLYPTSFVITLVIRSGHAVRASDPFAEAVTDTVLPVAWTGRIVERVGQGARQVKLVGLSAGSSMRRPGLTRHWQYSCPLVLYGSRCGADKEAATTTAVVVSASGNQITFEDNWRIEDTERSDYFGGLLQWQGSSGPEYRMILNVSLDGLTVTTTGPTGALSAGDEVEVSLGCPRTIEACGRLHNNIVNYGGHPYIPKFNPVNKNPFD
jgi:hypothetical protein